MSKEHKFLIYGVSRFGATFLRCINCGVVMYDGDVKKGMKCKK